MKKLIIAIAVVIMAAPCFVHADVIALKRDAGLVYQVGGGDVDNISSPQFLSSPTTTITTVNDTGLYGLGDGRWQNFGATTSIKNQTNILAKFDLSGVSGFAGGTITKAELRIHSTTGNNTANLYYVTGSDWAEGNQSGAFPGATPGASFAHAAGINTNKNRGPGDETTAPYQTWGDGDDFFSYADDATAAVDSGGTNTGVGEAWHVWDATEIVQLWANGTDNFGFAIDKHRNWQFDMSESGTDSQPVLFIDFEPAEITGVPEPTSIAIWSLLGFIGAAYAWRRRRA